MSSFKALVADQADGSISIGIKQLPMETLPAGEVLVRVAYSTLNYKDGLAISGRPGILRKFPMIPGIDFSGTVEHSTSHEFREGDRVVLTGAGAGETKWGGYSQYARWDAEHLVHVPEDLSLE